MSGRRRELGVGRSAVSSASCAGRPHEPLPHVLRLRLQPMILGLEDERISARYPENAWAHNPNKSWVSNAEGMLTSDRPWCSH